MIHSCGCETENHNTTIKKMCEEHTKKALDSEQWAKEIKGEAKPDDTLTLDASEKFPPNRKKLWMTIRPADIGIYNNVYLRNEYRLPDSLEGQTILDIGGHIGCFAVICVELGAKLVVSAEPYSENYKLLVKNTRNLPVLPLHVAVSNNKEAKLYLHTENAGHSLLKLGTTDKFEMCSTIGINNLLATVKPDIVKLDCEGAEYPIIDSTKFPDVKRLYIEYHHKEEYWQLANKKLLKAGFQCVRLDAFYPLYNCWLAEYVRP